MCGLAAILPIFFIFNSSYLDLTIDSKNRVILLSGADRIALDKSGEVHLSLDSMFAPLSISSSSFSIWSTSASEFISQKYSLWGEFLGEIKLGGNDIDSDEKGILIAGEQSYFVQTVSGARIILTWKEMERCALSKDSLYLYADDTLRVFKRDGKFISRRFIPGVKDLCIYNRTLSLLFGDSLVLSDTVLPVFGGRRASSNDKFIAVLSDSGIIYYPPPKPK